MFEHCKKQKKIKVARGETYPNHLQKCVSNTKIKVAREETYPNPSLQKCGGDSQLPSCQTCSKNSLTFQNYCTENRFLYFSMFIDNVLTTLKKQTFCSTLFSRKISELFSNVFFSQFLCILV